MCATLFACAREDESPMWFLGDLAMFAEYATFGYPGYLNSIAKPGRRSNATMMTGDWYFPYETQSGEQKLGMLRPDTAGM